MPLTNKYPARWAIARRVNGRSIDLIERTPLIRDEDARTVLDALHIPVTAENLDWFFPFDVHYKARCPTYELIERWYAYGLTGETGAQSSV